MTTSGKSGSGCFSGISRLLLCKGSLQTHPSDQIPELDSTEFDHAKKDPESGAKSVQVPVSAPGVVARLMGLDSLPVANFVPKRRSPDSVTRSRSVNFMDYLLEFDLAQARHHRRVKTSVSFREVPELSTKKNQDLLFLYLANVEKDQETMMRKSESEMKQKSEEKCKNKDSVREGSILKKERNKQRKNLKISRLKDEPRKVSLSHGQFASRFGSCKGAQVSCRRVSPGKRDVYRKSGETSSTRSPVKPINQKEALVESKVLKKIKNQRASKHGNSEYSLKDSSSVSVLDFSEKIPLHSGISLCDGSRHVDLNSKKKSSPKTSVADLEPKPIKENDYGSFENLADAGYYKGLQMTLCRLIEEDLKRANWVVKPAFEYERFEDICTEFGHQILDLLLHQLVEDLVRFHKEVQ